MTTIEDRKVTAVLPSKTTVNSLDDASTFLPKKKISPAKDSLKHAHQESDKKPTRLGQLIDILA